MIAGGQSRYCPRGRTMRIFSWFRAIAGLRDDALQVDHHIRLAQLDPARALLALLRQVVIHPEALLPASFGVVVTDHRVFDPALPAARDHVLDAAVSPVHPRHR